MMIENVLIVITVAILVGSLAAMIVLPKRYAIRMSEAHERERHPDPITPFDARSFKAQDAADEYRRFLKQQADALAERSVVHPREGVSFHYEEPLPPSGANAPDIWTGWGPWPGWKPEPILEPEVPTIKFKPPRIVGMSSSIPGVDRWDDVMRDAYVHEVVQLMPNGDPSVAKAVMIDGIPHVAFPIDPCQPPSGPDIGPKKTEDRS